MRRRRSFRRSARRKTEWLSAISSGCLSRLEVVECQLYEEGTGLDTNQFLLVDNPFDANPGVVSEVGEVTVVRLVGDLTLTGSFANVSPGVSWTALHFLCGIHISDADPESGASPKMSAGSPNAQPSKDWMWTQDVTLFSNTNVDTGVSNKAPNTQGLMHTEHIDIKVKRKLRKNERIILAIDVLRDTVGGEQITLPDAHVGGMMRALCMLP